jgi:hypothetical protein
MPVLSLRAHFDGKLIQRDEPYELPRDAQLIVTVLPPAPVDDERAGWAAFSARGLANAYGKDEPDYSAADIRP